MGDLFYEFIPVGIFMRVYIICALGKKRKYYAQKYRQVMSSDGVESISSL